MSNTMVIGGKSFKVIKPRKVDPSEYHKDLRGRRTLFDFYENPSGAKRAIWNEWVEWERDNDEVYDMRITSANGWAFTIGAYYVNPKTDEILGYFKITKDYDKLYLYD